MAESKEYYCLGCGKKIHSKHDYPYGWICLKCRPTTMLTLECSVCHKPFEVKWDTYRMKDPNLPWRCRRCNDDYRNAVYEAKPEEEKAKFVESQAARTKKYWAELSDQDREADSERRKKLWRKRRESGEADRIIDGMRRGRSGWWATLSDEERQHLEQTLTGRRKLVYFMSYLPDSEQRRLQKICNRAREEILLLALSKQSTEILSAAGRIDLFEQIYQTQPGRFVEWSDGMTRAFKVYLEVMEPFSLTNDIPSKTERQFIEVLKELDIPYLFQCDNKIVPDNFFELFPVNPITGSDVVSPYHCWDFRLHTHEGDVFVDVDGNAHLYNKTKFVHPRSGVVYTSIDNIKFNDSKRPYQTDGLPAYVIQICSNELRGNSDVLNVATGEKMPFRSFKAILQWMNMTEDERREVTNA